MRVGDRQQIARASLNPAIACIGLTARAMPITARVVRDGAVAAGFALINMSAERSGAAALKSRSALSDAGGSASAGFGR